MTLIEEVRRSVLLPSPRQARTIRTSAGVSQARLADEIGVHRVTLARWESGASIPRGKSRTRYATLLADIRRALMEEPAA